MADSKSTAPVNGTSLTIQLPDAAEVAPLFKQYDGQAMPQPAYVELTEDGQVTADWSGEIGGALPMTVWHGRTRRYRVPSAIKGSGLRALVERIQPLLERVHGGHLVEWDGSNLVGRLSDDAQAAEEQIERDIERLGEIDDVAQVWDAGDWLPRRDLLQHWTGPLDEAVQELETLAELDDIVLRGNVRETLVETAGWWLEQGHAGLTSVHITELIRAGRVTDEEATEYATRGVCS